MKKVSYEERMVFQRAINEAFDLVSITDERHRNGEPSTWKVNWGCCGAQPTDVAKDFMNELALACDIVDELNRCGVTDVWDVHTDRFDDDTVRGEVITEAAYHFKHGHIWFAMKLIFGEE